MNVCEFNGRLPLFFVLFVYYLVYVVFIHQVDLLYIQSLRSIADIHNSGVTEETFHEVHTLYIYMT